MRQRLRRLWRRYGKAALVVLLITAGIQGAEALGWLEGLEATVLDTMLRGRARAAWDDVFIVEITEDDYKTFFKSASPLDPDRLVELIDAVLSGSPGAVGVDIDTSDEIWCCRQDLRARLSN